MRRTQHPRRQRFGDDARDSVRAMPAPDERPLRGARLTALRHLRQVTQESAADALGVPQQSLALIEDSERSLPASLAVRAAATYGVPMSFFAVPPGASDSAPTTFHPDADATALQTAGVIQAFVEASRLFAHVSERSGYRAAMLPDAGEFQHDPTLCAAAVRQQLGCPAGGPILNVARSIERLGVGVLDGLDPWAGENGGQVWSICRPGDPLGRPLIAIVGPKVSGAAQRFTLAQELGHLVLDDTNDAVTLGSAQARRRASAFAAALLIPDHVVRGEVCETLSLFGYLRLKASYGAEVSVLVARAHRFGVITETRARTLRLQMGSRNWPTEEPVEVARERCLLFEQAYWRVFGSQGVFQVADLTGCDPRLLAHWLRQDASEPQAKSASNSVVDLAARRARTLGLR